MNATQRFVYVGIYAQKLQAVYFKSGAEILLKFIVRNNNNNLCQIKWIPFKYAACIWKEWVESILKNGHYYFC